MCIRIPSNFHIFYEVLHLLGIFMCVLINSCHSIVGKKRKIVHLILWNGKSTCRVVIRANRSKFLFLQFFFSSLLCDSKLNVVYLPSISQLSALVVLLFPRRKCICIRKMLLLNKVARSTFQRRTITKKNLFKYSRWRRQFEFFPSFRDRYFMRGSRKGAVNFDLFLVSDIDKERMRYVRRRAPGGRGRSRRRI